MKHYFTYPFLPLAVRRRIAVYYWRRTTRFPAAPWETANLAKATTTTYYPWRNQKLGAFVWGEGPTVLMVPGWNGRGSQLSEIGVQLAANGFRAIALDLPAHGSHPSHQTDLWEMTEAIESAVKTFGPIFALLSHSFGMAASLEYLSHHPKSCQRCIGIGTPASIRMLADQFTLDMAMTSELTAAFINDLEKSFWETSGGSARPGISPWDSLTLDHWAKSVSMPILLIHDENDPLPIVYIQEVTEQYYHCTLIKTSQLGHVRILRDQQVGEEIIRFLKAR